MRAMVVRRHGPPEVFEWREVPDPAPTASDVLIRVRAVGITRRLVVFGTAGTGKRSLWRAFKALAQTPRFHPMKLMERNISVIGVHLGRMPDRIGLLQAELAEIFRMYAAGQIKPVIGKMFPLNEAAAAHRYIHNHQNIGKVVLTVP